MARTKLQAPTLVTSGEVLVERAYAEAETYTSSTNKSSDLATMNIPIEYQPQSARIEVSTPLTRQQAELARRNELLRKLR